MIRLIRERSYAKDENDERLYTEAPRVKQSYYNPQNDESRRKKFADEWERLFTPDDHMLVCKDGKIINVQVGKKYKFTSFNGQRAEVVSIDDLFDEENGQSAMLTVAYRGNMYSVTSNQLFESKQLRK